MRVHVCVFITGLMSWKTSGQIIVTKGRTTIWSPLETANGFVRPWPSYNTYVIPWAHVSQLPKRHDDRFSHYCVHHNKGSRCFSVERITPKMAPSPIEIRPHLIHGSLGQYNSVPQMTSRSIQPFLQVPRTWPIYNTQTQTCRQTDRPTTLLRV